MKWRRIQWRLEEMKWLTITLGFASIHQMELKVKVCQWGNGGVWDSLWLAVLSAAAAQTSHWTALSHPKCSNFLTSGGGYWNIDCVRLQLWHQMTAGGGGGEYRPVELLSDWLWTHSKKWMHHCWGLLLQMLLPLHLGLLPSCPHIHYWSINKAAAAAAAVVVVVSSFISCFLWQNSLSACLYEPSGLMMVQESRMHRAAQILRLYLHRYRSQVFKLQL